MVIDLKDSKITWKEYYDKENVVLYIYNKSLKKQKMVDGEAMIYLKDLDAILKEIVN